MTWICEECGQTLPEPREWAVVVRGVEMNNGKRSSIVLARDLTEEAANNLMHEYCATGYDAATVHNADAKK